MLEDIIETTVEALKPLVGETSSSVDYTSIFLELVIYPTVLSIGIQWATFLVMVSISSTVQPVRYLTYFNVVGLYKDPTLLDIDIIGYFLRMFHEVSRAYDMDPILANILFWPSKYILLTEATSYLGFWVLLTPLYNALYALTWPDYFTWTNINEDVTNEAELMPEDLPRPGYAPMMLQILQLSREIMFDEAALNEQEMIFQGQTDPWTYFEIYLRTLAVWILYQIFSLVLAPLFDLSYLYVPILVLLSGIDLQDIPLNYSYYCNSLSEYLPLYPNLQDMGIVKCP